MERCQMGAEQKQIGEKTGLIQSQTGIRQVDVNSVGGTSASLKPRSFSTTLRQILMSHLVRHL